jgi:Ca2+-binding RTX toxin-like protein
VSVTGGVSGGVSDVDNTAYAGSVNFDTGNFTAAFGIEYTDNTLYGYSPDPDFVQSTVINATLNGAVGGTTAWSLLGGRGNDSIIGGSNNDIATGGAGDDSIFGGIADPVNGNPFNGGNDSLLGDAGNDTINGGDGLNTLEGGIGNDSLIVIDDGTAPLAVGTNNTLLGGDDNDVFFFGKVFGTASDTYLTATTSVVGGLGIDTIQFANGNVNVADSAYTLVSQIESIVGGNGADTFSFGTNATALVDLAGVLGGDGNDSLVLESTYNSATNPITLDGGLGNDIFSVDAYSQIQPATNSTIIGGGGEDTLSFANFIGSIGTPAVINDANVSQVEFLQLANNGSNYVVLNGSFAIDTVLGGDAVGVDNYINAQGLDPANAVTLAGGQGSDFLLGGPGTDWLQGFAFGPGAPVSASDTFTGGSAVDTFVLGNGSGNAYSGGAVQATINDFDIAGLDVIRLFNNGLTPGAVGFGDFVQPGGAGTSWEIQSVGVAVYTIAPGAGATATITDNSAVGAPTIATINYTGVFDNLNHSQFVMA